MTSSHTSAVRRLCTFMILDFSWAKSAVQSKSSSVRLAMFSVDIFTSLYLMLLLTKTALCKCSTPGHQLYASCHPITTGAGVCLVHAPMSA